VTGIGFLGAGAIIREGLSIRGLTTAGSLWIVAAIGMAAGAGYYWPALIGSALTVFALGPLRMLAFKAVEPFRLAEGRFQVELREGTSVEPLLAEIANVRSLEVEDVGRRRLVTLEVERGLNEGLVSRVADMEDVVVVRWRR
jgi:putative Mg2+ transporter-C (MgtC) family protein